MSAAIRAARSFDQEVLNYAKDGSTYWIRIEAEPIRDAAGEFSGFVAIETDATDKRIATQHERTTQVIGDKLLSSKSIDEACRFVVRTLLEVSDVKAAQVWTVENNGVELMHQAGITTEGEEHEWVTRSRDANVTKGERCADDRRLSDRFRRHATSLIRA